MKLKALVGELSPRELQKMARLSETTSDHIRWHIANGHSRPGFNLAVRMVKASQNMFPDEPAKWLSLREWFSMEAAENE